MTQIEIENIEDTIQFDTYVASTLVDIVYTKAIIGNKIFLTVDSSIKNLNEKDKNWIIELIENGLHKCNERSAIIIFS